MDKNTSRKTRSHISEPSSIDQPEPSKMEYRSPRTTTSLCVAMIYQSSTENQNPWMLNLLVFYQVVIVEINLTPNKTFTL